jgi:hypothetical protein
MRVQVSDLTIKHTVHAKIGHAARFALGQLGDSFMGVCAWKMQGGVAQ